VGNVVRRRTFILVSAVLLVLAACGGDGNGGAGGEGAPKATALAQLGEGEGRVDLVAWAGYVEDGSTDPKVDWVTPFEKQTGCNVNVTIGNTSDEMVTLMKSGKYDGVSASGDATLRLISAGDVSPVNTNLVPNYKDVYEALKTSRTTPSTG
jgi:putative spermidine/putrescine transport system substrate-binding protein